MANEINAVAGQLWGIPMGEVYTAGPGIKIDNVHKVVSVDETVLWEGAVAVSVGGEYNLSESSTNFERIRIEGSRNAVTSTDPVVQEYVLSVNNNSGNNIAFMAPLYTASVAGGELFIDAFGAKIYNNKMTISGYTRKDLTSTGITTMSNSPITITKIVGINRKSA